MNKVCLNKQTGQCSPLCADGSDRALWEEWVNLVVLGATVDAAVWGYREPLFVLQRPPRGLAIPPCWLESEREFLLEVKTACHVPYTCELSGFVLGWLCHAVSKCSVPSGKFWSLEVLREGSSVGSGGFCDC